MKANWFVLPNFVNDVYSLFRTLSVQTSHGGKYKGVQIFSPMKGFINNLFAFGVVNNNLCCNINMLFVPLLNETL